MLPLFIVVKIGVYLTMLLGIISALAVVTLRNIFHAALALVLTFLCVAGLYVALHAEFLAAVQILLYVGAVMTLIIFVIMLTHRLEDKTVPQKNRLSFPAILCSIAFLGVLWKLILVTPWPVKEATVNARIGILELGQALMGPYVFPFEFISVVLIAALVGALVMARREKEE